MDKVMENQIYGQTIMFYRKAPYNGLTLLDAIEKNGYKVDRIIVMEEAENIQEDLDGVYTVEEYRAKFEVLSASGKFLRTQIEFKKGDEDLSVSIMTDATLMFISAKGYEFSDIIKD